KSAATPAANQTPLSPIKLLGSFKTNTPRIRCCLAASTTKQTSLAAWQLKPNTPSWAAASAARNKHPHKAAFGSPVVPVVVVLYGGGDSGGVVVASGGEWRGGPNRSGDLEHLWVRRKNPAGKVFRRWSPAAKCGRLVGCRRLGSGGREY
nr:hypothetical protein [Tanacetum cinerariifolium]